MKNYIQMDDSIASIIIFHINANLLAKKIVTITVDSLSTIWYLASRAHVQIS